MPLVGSGNKRWAALILFSKYALWLSLIMLLFDRGDLRRPGLLGFDDGFGGLVVTDAALDHDFDDADGFAEGGGAWLAL